MKLNIKYISIALVCTLALGTVSCQNNGEEDTMIDPPAPPDTDTSLEVDTEDLRFSYLGGTEFVEVTSDLEWTTTTDEEWIEIDKRKDGSGFEVILESNEWPVAVPTELNGTVTVSNGVDEDITIDVFQALAAKTFIIDPYTSKVLYPDGRMRLGVIVSPENATDKKVDFESLDPSILTVDEEGNITPVGEGVARVIVSTVDVDAGGVPYFSDYCTVIVERPWVSGTITFRSDATWTVGDQEWSDVVLASGANKSTYTGFAQNEIFIPDAIRDGEFGDLFSWQAVTEFGGSMCPSPWRVPAMEDFVALDIALGGSGQPQVTTVGNREDRYIDEWGLQWAGHAFSMIVGGGTENGGGNNMGNGAGYWSMTEIGGNSSYALHLADNTETNPEYSINPVANTIKRYGYLVRCVRAATK